MIEHVVLLAVRPGEDAEPMLTALRELAETIPGIVSLSAGANITERGKQFTHGLSLRLERGFRIRTRRLIRFKR